MANQNGGAVRTTISIPAGLKARMDAVPLSVNWSAVAAGAFESKLIEIGTAQRWRERMDNGGFPGTQLAKGALTKVSDHFENWDNFANKCPVNLHAVDSEGKILWANETELKFMGYTPDEYIGRFVGDFHQDKDVIDDILARLTRDETLNAYPARLRARDGSTKFVMINSNVYRGRDGQFEHTRCFTSGIDEAAWKALKLIRKAVGKTPVTQITMR